LELDDDISNKRAKDSSNQNQLNNRNEDLRKWSLLAEKEIPISKLYHITAYFGDARLELNLPKSISKKKLKEELFRQGCKENELKGSKEDLLNIFKKLPSVKFLIDSRESIQRLLVTSLDKFNYDDTHLYKVKMPNRGDNPLGQLTYSSVCDDAMEMISMIKSRVRQEGFVFDDETNTYFNKIKKRHWYQVLGENEIQRDRVFNGLIYGTITKDSPYHIRKVQGEANNLLVTSYGNYDYDFDDYDTINKPTTYPKTLSLDDACLKPDDWLEFIYDFGSSSKITMKIDKIDDIANLLLPEINFCGRHPTRVSILSTDSLHRIPQQYP